MRQRQTKAKEMAWWRCWCCRRAAHTAGENASVLEMELVEVLNRSQTLTERKASAAKVNVAAAAGTYVFPLLFAIALGGAIKYLGAVVLSPWAVWLAVAGVAPELLLIATSKAAAGWTTKTEAQLQAAAARQKELIGRIKATLPMHLAIPLLLKYDPTGNHKVCAILCTVTIIRAGPFAALRCPWLASLRGERRRTTELKQC